MINIVVCAYGAHFYYPTTPHHAMQLLRSSRLSRQGPADIAVDEVHMVLRQVVDNVAKADELKALSRYVMLKREIVTTANQALGACLDVHCMGKVFCFE